MPGPTRSPAVSPTEGYPPLIVIGGATATGKTRLSLALAEAIGTVEIISADSRQVYRGMDIGTAKVDRATRQRVAHHGLDLVDPDQPFTVADYLAHARSALMGIATEGRVAILVGGSGLYLRAVARGLPIGETGRDARLRSALEVRLASDGLLPLVAELRGVAPGAASRTDLANPRRVVRALERALLVGDRPPPPPAGYPGPLLWLGLEAEPVEHRASIAARSAAQFASGLLDEAVALRTRYEESLRAFSAVGYPEAFEVLHDRLSVTAAVEVTAQRTWAYARRQRTWFRREPDVRWLPASDPGHISTAISTARRFLDQTGS